MANTTADPRLLSDTQRAPERRASQISEKRRDKKRVADRLCQRQARARTKNRIAELEALVSNLTSQSGNEICRDLRAQLDRSRAECHSLQRRLVTISSIAQAHVGDEPETLHGQMNNGRWDNEWCFFYA